MEIDKSECDCEGDALLARETATWKTGDPTGYYCQKCGYVFGYEWPHAP